MYKSLIQMSDYEYEKYKCSPDSIKETLDKYGVAIIPEVLDENECSKMLDEIWTYFEYITKNWETPITRNNSKSWREIYSLLPLHSMLFQHWNIGHSQACWNVRQNPKILDIYSNFWNCKKEELLVSFDGLSFNVPPEITNRGWNKNNIWLHSDQSFACNDFQCIQGWVTALDVNEDDATLSILEESHKYHKEFGSNFNIKSKKNWHKLTDNEKQFYYDRGCLYKKIKCPKGSLVVWDSRTIHCGVEANKHRKNANFRAIIYICYMPRKMSTEKQLEKKREAFNNMRLTSHWPCKIKLFPKNPRDYGNGLPTINLIEKPKLQDIGYKLAGF